MSQKNYLNKIREDFGEHGRVSVWKSRKNHIFFERRDGAGMFDTKTDDPVQAYITVAGWVKHGFPVPRCKKQKILFHEFCMEYWNKNPEKRETTELHAKMNAGWIRLYVAPYFKNDLLSDITPNQISTFLDSLRHVENFRYRQFKEQDGKGDYDRNKYLSPATIKNIRNSVSLPLQYAGRLGMNSRSPDWAASCRLRNAKGSDTYFDGMVSPRDVFEPEELEKLDLAKWSDKRARICYAIARATGMRYGEIRGLKIGNVRPDRIVVDSAYNNVDKAKGTKTGKYREVPIPEWLYLEIQAYIASLPFENLKDGDRWLLPRESDFAEPVDENFLNKKFDKMMKKLGIPKFRKLHGVVHTRSVHSLRHCKDMELMSAGLSIRQISNVVGHSPIMVTHYTNHYSSSEFDESLKKMQAAGLMDNPREKKTVVVRMDEAVNK